MVRTQIQLDEHSFTTLREVALRQHRSMAACIRTAIERFLGDVATAQNDKEDLSDIAGKFRPLPMDEIKEHDRHWADAVMSKGSTP